MGTIEFWKKSPWKKIDADGMDQECKRFTKDLRQLDKEMRVWLVLAFKVKYLYVILVKV